MLLGTAVLVLLNRLRGDTRSRGATAG